MSQPAAGIARRVLSFAAGMPTLGPIRAMFFDAGNTLLRIDYAAIAAALAALGVSATAGALQRAE